MALNIGTFLKQTIDELNNSMPDGWELNETIEFEITVSTAETSDGKLDIKVFSLGANAKGEAVQKMNFSITNKAKAAAVSLSQFNDISKGMAALIKPLQNLDQTSQLDDKNDNAKEKN